MADNGKKAPAGKRLLAVLLGAALLVLAFSAYFIAKILNGHNDTGLPASEPTEETAKLPEEAALEEDVEEPSETQVDYFTDEDGTVIPDYETVDENEYDPALFKTEGGRVMYDSPEARYGIDVSSHQGEVDWNKVAADGIDFAIIRAAYRGYGQTGSLNEDEYFRKNAEAARNAGLSIGAYIFSQAVTTDEAVEEAEYIISMTDGLTLDYPIVFDWESITTDTARTDGVTSEQLTEIAAAFCERIKKAGYRPAVYLNTTQGYLEYGLDRISEFDLWLADYGELPDFYYKFNIWQYTNQGTVDGITGSVDMNISFKNYAG